MANNFKIYAPVGTYRYATDNDYENSSFRTNGGIPNQTASSSAVNTALYCASILTKTLIDALVTNTGISVNIGIESTEAELQTMFGNQLSNLNVKSAGKWTTQRTFTIKDADATNSAVSVNVDGSGNVILNLPSTIKATLSGTASNAAKINNKSFDMTFDSATGTLSIIYN